MQLTSRNFLEVKLKFYYVSNITIVNVPFLEEKNLLMRKLIYM